MPVIGTRDTKIKIHITTEGGKKYAKEIESSRITSNWENRKGFPLETE